jgi:glycosyltransferase involved in cell wall biosynthesis
VPAPAAPDSRRILHACDFHLKYTTGLARGMADQGARVALLTRTHDMEFGDVPGAMRAFVRRVGGDRVEHLTLPGRVRELRRLPDLAHLRRTIRHLGPDVVHVQDGIGNDVRMLLAAGVRPKRFAMTIHDATPHPGDRWSVAVRVTEPALLRTAGVIFVHSETVRDVLRRRDWITAPIVVVPHGMAAARVAPLPRRPSLLFFGRITTYYKGLDVLLDAMPLIWERVPEVTLTIAGSGEVEPHPVLEDARVTVRNEHVHDDEVPELFAAATSCVQPYRHASQSGVGSQAKSFGRPIVATTVGGLPELVAPGAGRLVPPEDPAALADALIDVVTTPGRAESMSRATTASVADASWTRVAELTFEAYDRYLR